MLTKRQKQILDYIEKYFKKKGLAPSLKEIKKHFKLSSESTVHQQINKLVEKGYIEKQKNQPRGISISTRKKLIRIPLLGTIAAGEPIEAIQEKETIAVSQNKLPRSGELYALRVVGDSMINENINDGDIILVKQQTTAENGQKVVALIDNHEATLKKFYKERGHIRLQPANKKIEPIIIKRDTDITIQGIVIDVIKNEKDSIAEKLLPTKPIKRRKQVPENRILCGDVLKELKKFPDNSIDLAVTSPPYNLKNSTGNGMKDGRGGKWANAALQKGYSHHDDCMPHDEYVKWQRSCIKEVMRTLKDDGAFFYNHKWRVQGGLLQNRQDIVDGFPVRQIIIWRRKGGINFNPGYFLPTYEVLYLIAKPKFKLAKKANAHGDVWEFTQDMNNPHPAPFPVELVERIIGSTKAELVLDPFMGSGTTAVASVNLKRNYLGIDISPEYCEMAEKRIKNHKKGLGTNGFTSSKKKNGTDKQNRLFA